MESRRLVFVYTRYEELSAAVIWCLHTLVVLNVAGWKREFYVKNARVRKGRAGEQVKVEDVLDGMGKRRGKIPPLPKRSCVIHSFRPNGTLERSR